MKRKFIADFMVGRLCRWLRLIGEDVEYYKGDDKTGIIYMSLKTRSIILTRNCSLSRRKALGICLIKDDDFRKQLRQVIDEFSIDVDPEKIFTRCTECNTMLVAFDKKKVKGRVPAFVFETQNKFSICRECQKIYWKGTHSELVKKVLNSQNII